jgi:trk system potassium uptake protein TrkH
VNAKAIIYAVSVLIFSVLFMLMAIGIIFYVLYSYWGELDALTITIRYLIAIAISLSISSIIALIFKGNMITDIAEGFIVVLISWILIPFITAFIYFYSIDLNFIDAFFESLSGFSGTGLTMLSNVEKYPYVILIMRSITQWLGEIGIVVVSGALLPFVHRSIRTVYIIERGSLLAPTITSTMRRLYTIYSTYTFIGIIMLMLSGMNLLDAIAHSMTAIATGGMSTSSQSIGTWFKGTNYLVLFTTSVIMIIGALNFVDSYNILRGKIKDFMKSIEVRGFFLIMFILMILVALYSVSINSYNKIVIWLYHLISGYTTTGFQLSEIYNEPEIIKMTLICAMTIGGATFSTAGGIKTRRVLIILKSILWEFQRPFRLKGAITVKRIGHEEIDDETISSVLSYTIIYIFIMLLFSGILYISLSLNGVHKYSFIDSLFETVSALSCVGLSVGITSQSLPLASKIILMIAMYMGRLEFLPMYLFVGWHYRKEMIFR